MYCLPYFLFRFPLKFNVIARFVLKLFLVVGFVDFVGILPWYQGSEYHISGMVGNPNLLAVIILFLVFLSLSANGKLPLKLIDFTVLIMLCITLCRTT